MIRYAFFCIVVASLAVTVRDLPLSQGAFPEDPPNNPDYDQWETGEGGDSLYDEQWNLFSFTPRGVRLTMQASGVSADLAWRTTTGRKDVVIAILDSGIDWGERDLINQFYLNRGNCPSPRMPTGSRPQGSSISMAMAYSIFKITPTTRGSSMLTATRSSIPGIS